MREVGTLWIGGRLSWMEQLCLQSFVDAGQRIALFSYEYIPNVPEGVIRRDGREVLDTGDFIKYEKKDSFALFADLFRLHMIARNPGLIWVDTDVYCHRPLAYDSDFVMGYELPGVARVNNAVLGVPADSAVLAEMLDFVSDRFAIPPFVKPALRDEYAAARDAGAPVHVSRQPWGVWGPMMLTHFVAKHALQHEVQPLDAFYPVAFPQRTRFLKDEKAAARLITPRTTALHLWASNKRELGLRHGGVPPAGSYLAMLLARHGIRPEAAPIAGRGRRQFDAGLIDAVDLPEVGSFADVGGTAQSLALAAQARWDCEIALVDLTHKGEWPEQPSAWVAPYREFLATNGADMTRVRLVNQAAELRPTDLIASLSGFGDVNKIKYLKPVLEACLHADSRLLLDIRKGSGSRPFLKDYGTLDVLGSRDDGGVEVTRAQLTPLPRAETVSDPAWAEIARGLAGAQGFYRDNGSHSFLYMPRGRTLVVTFDNLDIAMNKREERRPWGFHFIEKQGWSMLGVMAGGWTWYRDAWVAAEFDRLAAEGFFAQFERVVFYGASMGGYAACAFSAACPGAEVVAISPQSTLSRALVPWETRYKVAWDRDWSGRYGDAAEASRSARRVSILFDPYEPLDAAHTARFSGTNVVRLRTPLLGHRLGSSLQQMGILNPIILAALDGSLQEADFYRNLRARRDFPRYQRELFKRALARGHPALARRLGAWVLARGDNRYIRQEMKAL